MPPVIDKEICEKCGTCIDVCSEDIYFGSIQGELPVVSHGEFCYHCNLCVQECPADAIRLRTPLQMMVPFK